MRILIIIGLIVAFLAIPAFLVGDRFDELLDAERVTALLRQHGALAALAGIVAISADLFVPMPAHAIMTSFGIVHGWLLGGLLASAGTFLAGMIAYWLCRLLGPKVAVAIAGQRDMDRLHIFFEKFGMLAIICSRWIPLVPEVISSLAGLSRMTQTRFVTGNMIGSLSVGFFYAYVGHHYGAREPGFAISISIILPLILLPIFLFIVTRSSRPSTEVTADTNAHGG
jgi:uncharacterized membrane protein YdjX (TVP38/TMEM64 family)